MNPSRLCVSAAGMAGKWASCPLRAKCNRCSLVDIKNFPGSNGICGCAQEVGHNAHCQSFLQGFSAQKRLFRCQNGTFFRKPQNPIESGIFMSHLGEMSARTEGAGAIMRLRQPRASFSLRLYSFQYRFYYFHLTMIGNFKIVFPKFPIKFSRSFAKM